MLTILEGDEKTYFKQFKPFFFSLQKYTPRYSATKRDSTLEKQ